MCDLCRKFDPKYNSTIQFEEKTGKRKINACLLG